MQRNARARPAGANRASRRFARVALVVMSALCVIAAFAPAGSAANLTFAGNFSMTGVPGGALGNNNSSKLAVDEATGDVYVVDTVHDVVDKFDSNGNYLSQITGSSTAAQTFGFAGSGFDDIAVDNSGGASQGDVYVWSRAARTVFAFGSSGTERWEAPDPGSSCGIGVDQGGNPWLGDASTQSAVEISPTDGSATGTTINVVSSHCHMAFDNDSALYMTSLNTALDKFNPTISFDGSPEDRYGAVATSFKRNDVFSVSVNHVTPTITQWDKNGSQLSTVTGSNVGDDYEGVALDGVRNRLYVSDIVAGVVQMYTVAPQEPTIVVSAATGIGIHEATFNGTVNPNGDDVSDCHFAYGTLSSGTFDQTVPCTPAAPISGVASVPVSADVTGLSPNTDYEFELVTTNGGGTNTSDPVLLRTLTQPLPVPVVGSASGIALTGANVSGAVNPGGDSTTCVVEYGTVASGVFGSQVPCSSNPGSGTSAVPVGATLAGLNPNTDYQYRITATNSGGTASSAPATFRTLTPASCATDPSLCIVPPPTCPTDLSKCPPPTHKLAGFSGTTLLLKLSCSGVSGQTCSGTLVFKSVIKVKVKHGKKTRVVKKTITVATVSYRVAAGGTTSIKLKLTSAAKTALKSGGLTASARGLSGSIKLPKTKVRKKTKKH